MHLTTFEKEIATIPKIVADINNIRRKMEAAFSILESLEEAITTLEVTRATQEMNNWKKMKQEELNKHKLKGTAEIEGLEAKKQALERAAMARALPSPPPSNILEEIAASMFYTPKTQF